MRNVNLGTFQIVLQEKIKAKNKLVKLVESQLHDRGSLCTVSPIRSTVTRFA